MKRWLASSRTRLRGSSLRRWPAFQSWVVLLAFFRARWRSPTYHPARSRRWKSSGSFTGRSPLTRLELQSSLRWKYWLQMSPNVTHCLQIERMFLKAAADEPAPPGMSRLQSSFVQHYNVTHMLQVQDARHLPPRPRGRDGSSPPNPPRHPSSDRSSSTRGKVARRACAGVSCSFNGEHHPRA